MLICSTCSYSWDGTTSPVCPQCIAVQWARCPNLIMPKHDPGVLPSGSPWFRSVITEEVVQRKPEFLSYAAASGVWYHSTKHKKDCVFTPDPLGVIPGSGIPSNSPWPTHALDGLVVADATKDAHLYTADQVRFRREVGSGLYRPLARCSVVGCHNLVTTGESQCVLHRGGATGS
jgi:hypothetical protein